MFGLSSIDEYATPVELGVKWSMGAPIPYLLQDEGRAFLAFYLRETDPNWDGTYITVVDPASPVPASIGLIVWHSCYGALFTNPNDEAIQGHRLWARGLADAEPYGAAEVHNSAWIAELERTNRVHRSHNPKNYAALKHYILMFHDSTFECVAKSYSIETVVRPMSEVLVQLARRLVRLD